MDRRCFLTFGVNIMSIIGAIKFEVLIKYATAEELKVGEAKAGEAYYTSRGIFKLVENFQAEQNNTTVIDITETNLKAVLLPNEPLPDIEAVVSDTRPASWFAEGQQITTRDGVSYRIAPKTAVSPHLRTAGGLNLFVLPDRDGYCAVEAFFFKGDGSPGDLARLQTASDFTPYLKFQSKTYQIGEYSKTPDPWGYRHRKVCIFLRNGVAWRSLGQTRLQITSAAQAGGGNSDTALLLGVGEIVSAAGNKPLFSAPDFTFDENATEQGFGAGVALYGFDIVDLNRVSFENCNPVRIGADQTQLTGELRGSASLRNMVGTFSMGGKPGGITRWSGGDYFIQHTRGGLNIECENLDEEAYGIRDNHLEHAMIEANINSVVGFDLDDAHYTGAFQSPVEFCKIADGAKRVNIGTISLTNAESAGTGRATAMKVNPGQNDSPVEHVSVGRIIGKNIRQGIVAEVISETTIGDISIGSIEASNIGKLIDAKNTGGDAGGYIRSLYVGYVRGRVQDWKAPSTGTAISASSDPSSSADNGYAPFLNFLGIGGGHLESVRKRAFDIRGVRRVEVSNLTVDAHLAGNPVGEYAGTTYNVIEADEIVLDSVKLRGFAGSNLPLELRPKVSCRLVGLEIEAGDGAGAALFFNGSGAVVLDNCSFKGAKNALNFRSMTESFDAAAGISTKMNSITIPGHTFRHGEKVRYAAGSKPVDGLTDGGSYYVIYIDRNTIALSVSLRGAAVSLGAAGAGTARLSKALEVTVLNTRNECTNLQYNEANTMSYTASGTW